MSSPVSNNNSSQLSSSSGILSQVLYFQHNAQAIQQIFESSFGPHLLNINIKGLFQPLPLTANYYLEYQIRTRSKYPSGRGASIGSNKMSRSARWRSWTGLCFWASWATPIVWRRLTGGWNVCTTTTMAGRRKHNKVVPSPDRNCCITIQRAAPTNQVISWPFRRMCCPWRTPFVCWWWCTRLRACRILLPMPWWRQRITSTEFLVVWRIKIIIFFEEKHRVEWWIWARITSLETGWWVFV